MSDKTFTQEQVNQIVQERLAKERSKLDTELIQREQELANRELMLTARQKLAEAELPDALLGALNVSSVEELENSLDILKKEFTNTSPAASRAQKELAAYKLDMALNAAILKAKGRNPEVIKRLLNVDALELQADGIIKGLDLKALQKSDPYLFEITTTTPEGDGCRFGSPGSSQPSENALIRDAMGLR